MVPTPRRGAIDVGLGASIFDRAVHGRATYRKTIKDRLGLYVEGIGTVGRDVRDVGINAGLRIDF